MDTAILREHLPTFTGFIEKRQKAARNRLPKHLRPIAIWPIWLQIGLNGAILVALWNVVVGRDEFFSDYTPAIIMIVCLLFLIYSITSAFHLKKLFPKGRGSRLARLNFWLMVLAFLGWAGCVVSFVA